MYQEGIEIVDERLYFARVFTLHARGPTASHCGQGVAQFREPCYPAATKREACNHETRSEYEETDTMGKTSEEREPLEQRWRYTVDENEKANAPEAQSHEEPPAKRALHCEFAIL
jgi:hypothetical protein